MDLCSGWQKAILMVIGMHSDSDSVKKRGRETEKEMD